MNLTYDTAAHTILKNDEFIDQWKKLHSNCRYATSFQEPAFVCSWYEAYRYKWKPLLIYRVNSNRDLSGLLMLAYDQDTRELVQAGGSQAEYQSWLAIPGEEVAFLSEAFRDLLKRYNAKKLQFRYFPGVETVNEVISKLPIRASIAIRKRPRPLMTLNAEEIKASFAKKSNKSRFNRLKKLGKVDFYRIKDINSLNNVFDELIMFYDLRQGAINFSQPFHEDKTKRKFHIDLLAKGGDNVYVTVTCLNDRPIAGFWGLASKDTMHLGMVMHSPFLAEHSIGKLHLMQLSQQLLDDGFTLLDLTPGSDPWKERFANAHDEVAEIILYRSRLAKTISELIYRILDALRRRANKAGITTTKLKLILHQIQDVSPVSLVGRIGHWIKSDQEYCIYQINRAEANRFQTDERVKCNEIDDLFLYETNDEGQSVNEFLSRALQQFETGERMYTMRINDRLVCCAWMRNSDTETQPFVPPSGSRILHDFYLHSDSRQSEYNKTFTAHLVVEAFADQDVQQVFVLVPARNKSYRQHLEGNGFSYLSSIIHSCRMGKETSRMK